MSERMLASYHEAGHVVANLLCGFRVEHAQIDGPPRTRRNGTTRRIEPLANLITTLAGSVAESMASGEHLLVVLQCAGATDLQRAQREAQQLADLHLFKSPDHALLVAEQRARALLEVHWQFVERCARELYQRGRID
jgi:hypothetical protein